MPDEERIPPSREALREASELSGQILTDIESGTVFLANIVLRAGRLARLMNDFTTCAIMEYEAGGYPTDPDGFRPEVFELGRIAGRVSTIEDPKTKKESEVMFPTSISELEAQMALTSAALAAAVDSDAPPPDGPFHLQIQGNTFERNSIRGLHYGAAKQLSKSRAFIHGYVSQTYYELKLSGIADDAFARIRQRVDETIGKTLPTAVRKLTAVYDNLKSDNPEDWSNAVHGCRRLLQDLADASFPATDEIKVSSDGTKQIKLGKDNYINRLIAFAESQSESERFREIVGSQLGFLGDRLDAVFRAAQKGSHADIVNREEAERYVVYTYLVVGDLLSLLRS